ncbi:hypothetical protein GJS26_04232 [Pectobacterium carotovorum subsp. carotovorum]|nr:hypothetical protein [Pectobacterium carotovorum subsp. carotovorum]
MAHFFHGSCGLLQIGGLFFRALAEVSAASGNLAGTRCDRFTALTHLFNNPTQAFAHTVHGCQHAVVVAGAQIDADGQISLCNFLGDMCGVSDFATQQIFYRASDQDGDKNPDEDRERREQ